MTKAELEARLDEVEGFLSEVADGTIPLGDVQDAAEDLLQPAPEDDIDDSDID